MPVIKDWLAQASQQLKDVGIKSASLDAEILLSNILDKNRTYLHAHPEQLIETKQLSLLENNLRKRLKRIPIAYIVGHKEFYGRDFIVTPDTLIPRPESESIIELLKKIINNYEKKDIHLVDVGTGSGCLGITAKLEFPRINVTLSDISPKALAVARQNSDNLSSKVNTIQSDLLQNITNLFDIIIANLPYVDQEWETSPETKYEPAQALFANNKGLGLIEKLISQADKKLQKNGYLIIEADPIQHEQIIELAKEHQLTLLEILGFVISFMKD
jgi:release factor glutamine methyltransferase